MPHASTINNHKLGHLEIIAASDTAESNRQEAQLLPW